jgi:phenol hydroxylase P0 protein
MLNAELLMPHIDSDKRWVRVIRKTETGFIEFEFFVGDMDLCVELILPTPAFKEFCENNRVQFMDHQAPDASSQALTAGLLKLVK